MSAPQLEWQRPPQSAEPLPVITSGRHVVVIWDATIEFNGDHQLQSFKFVITEAMQRPYDGNVWSDRMDVRRENPQKQAQASARLREYLLAVGIIPTLNADIPRGALTDLNSFKHKPFIIQLSKDKYGNVNVKHVEPLALAERDTIVDEYTRFKAEQDAAGHTGNALPIDPATLRRSEKPHPLSRELPPAKPFPFEALGPKLGNAARAIQYLVQCPDAIAGQSVLAAASLAVQPHADVLLPTTGKPSPLSLTASRGARRQSNSRVSVLA